MPPKTDVRINPACQAQPSKRLAAPREEVTVMCMRPSVRVVFEDGASPFAEAGEPYGPDNDPSYVIPGGTPNTPGERTLDIKQEATPGRVYPYYIVAVDGKDCPHARDTPQMVIK